MNNDEKLDFLIEEVDAPKNASHETILLYAMMKYGTGRKAKKRLWQILSVLRGMTPKPSLKIISAKFIK